MANLPQNKAYAIMNYGATLNGENEKRLNLYYNGSISNGQNVCLWDTDYSTEQKWIFVDDKLKTARNQNFVLDRHITTNNADVWEDLSSKDANQKVEICETYNGSNLYTIRLKTGGRYLTAVNSSNGTSSGTSSTSSGNVYWSSSQVGNMSLWRFYEYSGESYPSTNVTLSSDVKIPQSLYNYQSQQEYPWENGACGISTYNFQQTGCAVMAQVFFSQIMENDQTITPENMFQWGLQGTTNDGYPNATWTQNSSSPLNFQFYQNIDSFDDAKGIIFNELLNQRPVIIHLHNPNMQNASHYVVGCGLKVGTNKSNIDEAKIYVIDPWTLNNVTLADTMTDIKWNTYDNVRIAVAK